ncbi:replication/maintenance protein RepL [Clostridioides difficile]|nr:replication/maintenance protein RepL [Clostridioides difficile]MDK3166973.1 replication/maintenance protein RepL [Clostridioides difficile]
MDKTLKKDLNQEYTESKSLVMNKSKYMNVCFKNYIKVVEGMYTKRDLIPLKLINSMDKNNKIRKTLYELSCEFEYPKTSLSSLFTELKKMDFLQRVKNGEYMINPHIAYKCSRADKESLLAEYNQIKRPNKVSK